jgi:hypothetical protein
MDAFAVLPCCWLGLARPVPYLQAEAKYQVRVYLSITPDIHHRQNNTMATQTALPDFGLLIIPFYMSWPGQLALVVILVAFQINHPEIVFGF